MTAPTYTITDYDDCIQPHPSGCGAYIQPPRFTYYRFWRDPCPTEDVFAVDAKGNIILSPDTRQPTYISTAQIPVLQGYTDQARRYLDWEVPVGVPFTYRLELSVLEDGPWVQVQDWVLDLQPTMSYSAIEDGENYDVSNPRDALVVFYGTRLAQLARAGKLYTRNKAYRKKYNTTTAYSFDDADMPVLSIGLGYGSGHGGDLGWNLTEENIRLDIVGMAADKLERDSLTAALRGLVAEVDLFLGDLGCVETSYGQLRETEQHSEPMLYLIEQSITTTLYTHIHIDSGAWELIPIGGWAGIHVDGENEVGAIFSPNP
jgi:hypothetical protein